MLGGSRDSFVCWTLAAAIGAFLGLGVAPEAAADSLSALTPLDPTALGNATIKNNVFTSNQVTETGTVSGNTIAHSTVNNGAIQGNAISSNRGVTSVLMNTGNNVNFNSSFIVNVLQSH